MINKFRNYLRTEFHLAYSDVTRFLKDKINDYRKENQSLAGRIKILEEQQEIMHNFLIEINKYLVKITETDKKCDEFDALSNERSLNSARQREFIKALNSNNKGFYKLPGDKDEEGSQRNAKPSQRDDETS